MATATGAVEKLDIGKVMQVSFALVQRYFSTFAILALLLGALPALLNVLIQQQTMTSVGSVGARFNSSSGLWSSILGAGMALVTGAIFQAASIQISVSDLNGGTISVGDSLRLGLKHIVPLVIIALLQGIAVGLGSFLLVAPGIMMACAFAVAIPARVMENIPTLSTFRRSRDLTRGNRWRILGLGMIYLIIFGVFEAVLFALFGGLSGMMNPTSMPRLILLPVITMILRTMSAATVGVLYFELRRIRDGVGPTDLAAVFD